VFNRNGEFQYQPASVSSITTITAFNTVSSITVNGVLLPYNTYSQISSHVVDFSPALAALSTIEVNGFNFVLSQDIHSPSSKSLNFGESVAIQNNQLVIGSPHTYDLIIPSRGEVFFYALDTAINGIKTIPISDIALSITPFLINGWPIQSANASVTGLLSALNNATPYTGVSAYTSGANLNLVINPALHTTGIVA